MIATILDRMETAPKGVGSTNQGLTETPNETRRTAMDQPTRICVIDGCQRVYKAWGYCDMHYRRLKRHGKTPRRTYFVSDNLPDYIEHYGWTAARRVPRLGPCWEWNGRRTPAGYGTFWRNSRTTYAHRTSYEVHNGPIPEGLIVRHKCDNPPCINPEHLELGTHADNSRDREERGRGRYSKTKPK